ncbi:hypothetical protein CCUS01_06959 [Colletotrichum cuscutae]|uniref:Uncharacterized protein n=1 Tax=Colletotrichum cuscutae TaxID=1209917 RepID=A0AAI9UZF9_9PEZI|nr:hypothetical protein CCUS01_06959 [Colletotrichum cuscutae]
MRKITRNGIFKIRKVIILSLGVFTAYKLGNLYLHSHSCNRALTNVRLHPRLETLAGTASHESLSGWALDSRREVLPQLRWNMRPPLDYLNALSSTTYIIMPFPGPGLPQPRTKNIPVIGAAVYAFSTALYLDSIQISGHVRVYRVIRDESISDTHNLMEKMVIGGVEQSSSRGNVRSLGGWLWNPHEPKLVTFWASRDESSRVQYDEPSATAGYLWERRRSAYVAFIYQMNFFLPILRIVWEGTRKSFKRYPLHGVTLCHFGVIPSAGAVPNLVCWALQEHQEIPRQNHAARQNGTHFILLVNPSRHCQPIDHYATLSAGGLDGFALRFAFVLFDRLPNGVSGSFCRTSRL